MFSVFGEILKELIRIRIALEGRNGMPLPDGDDVDESSVLYTDDEKVWKREAEELKFYGIYGRYPSSGEKLPGPVDESGREWSPTQSEEVEGE